MLDLNVIYSLKLSTGEEIICKVTQITEHHYQVSEPASIVPGQAGLQFIPFMFSIDKAEPIKLSKQHIVMCGYPNEAIKNKYVEIITGLKLPPEKKILLGA